MQGAKKLIEEKHVLTGIPSRAQETPVGGAYELNRNVRIPKFLPVETMGKRSSKVPVNRERS